jgi:hypothetical protein
MKELKWMKTKACPRVFGAYAASVSSLMKEVLGPHVKYTNTLIDVVHEIANGMHF